MSNDLVGTILGVNDISGLPIFEVNTTYGGSFSQNLYMNNNFIVDRIGATRPSGYILSATANGMLWQPSSVLLGTSGISGLSGRSGISGISGRCKSL